jgi:DNA-binding GntR family transcriptional regulator
VVKKSASDLKKEAYEYIRNKIISCEFKPGDMISEKELQQEIGVSRTPIREALFKLENEYFVNVYPRRGIFVSSITAKNIKEVYQLRRIIETTSLELAQGYISDEWLLGMKKKFEDKPEEIKEEEEVKNYFINLDWEFHSYIIKMCRNSLLVDIMENIWNHTQRMRILTYNIEERYSISTKEHLEIIEYLLERDLDKATQALGKHLNNGRDIALKYIEI